MEIAASMAISSVYFDAATTVSLIKNSSTVTSEY